MEKVAFIVEGKFIYWNSIILTMAAAVAICFFLFFYFRKSGNLTAGFAVLPIAMVLSVVIARFVHWYCRENSYDGFVAAMTDYTTGSFALLGVFAGCLLAAALVRLICLHRNLPEMLDCMCLASLPGIVVGRMASFFNTSDRGQVMKTIQSLPFAYPVTNTVSGATEYRLATFVIQAMFALALFLVLMIFYIRGQNRGKLRDGDTCLIYLLIYGASQVVLDSTRYDSLFFRSNGFVSVVQVFSAVALGVAIAVFSVRLVKARGFKIWYVPVWVAIAGFIGGGGFMEYYVQRHGDQAAFAYAVMSGCLVVVIGLTLLIRLLAVKAEQKAEMR